MFKIIMSNLHLEKIFWIVKTKFIYMLLVGVLLATGAGLYGNYCQNPKYRATVTFYAYSNPDYVTDQSATQTAGDVSQAKTLLKSYMQILKSKNFLNTVIKETETDCTASDLQKMITAVAVADTASFEVYVDSEDPLLAYEIANAIGKLAPNEIIRIVKSGGIETIEWAELPTTPFEEMSVIKLAIIGGAGGFVLAAVFFVLRGLLDTTVRRKYEIEDLFTIPIIGTVPMVLPAKKKGNAEVILNEKSPFAYKEAYSNMRANMMFIGKGEKCPVFAFTSADENEGKSLTALNIAISYSQMGKKVLLLDCDMRKSRYRKKLQIFRDEDTGLSEYLAGIKSDANAKAYNDNLDIVISGEFPPNPAELLATDKLSSFLEVSKEKYDVIVLDLPPLGIVSDALAVIREVTTFIIVARERVTKFEREEMIVRKLESMEGTISGIVYNGISIKSPDYNYKSYGRNYY